jgi:hypothetical protein
MSTVPSKSARITVRAALGILAALVTASPATQMAMKHVGILPLSPSWGVNRLVLGDADHDSLGEVYHYGVDPPCFELVEYRPVNRYVVVLRDTSKYPIPETISLAYFVPYDIGDVDRDGKTDIVGQGWYDSAGTTRVVLAVFESKDSWSYPDSLAWWSPTPMAAGGLYPPFYASLDGDSLPEIVMPWWYDSARATAVFERVGGNRESLVCVVPGAGYAYSVPTTDDYDQNGRTDYTFEWQTRGDWVVECTGDNSYALVCSLNTGFGAVSNRFAGHDVDRNGKPEWFEVSVTDLGGWRYLQTLCQFEASGEHQYTCDTVDSAVSLYEPFCGQSVCADVDGDSLEEIVWSCGGQIYILEATGPHQYETVSQCQNWSGLVSVCNAADFNGNGYKEIYVGGDSGSFVLEVECIRVLSPDTNRYLHPGDTCEIRWRIYTPPRCDSVSLFLRSDSNTVNGFYRLDTIATRLSPNESTYSWVVPDTVLDSARILAIAYGPGWQFDESDRAFRIAPAGVAGPTVSPPREWSLSVNPNPARGTVAVRYDVPRQSRMSVGVYDVDGRLVRSLSEGDVAPGRYEARLSSGTLPAGVYFCRLAAEGQRFSRKVVLTE